MAIAEQHTVEGDLERHYRARSLWLDTVPGSLAPRDPLPGDVDVDVCVVGAGFTGLWTAYNLIVGDPTLRIVVLERDIAGFGTAGRNGGFLSAGIAGEARVFAKTHGMDGVRRAERLFMDTVHHVGEVIGREGIDCGHHPGGALRIATSPTQVARVEAGEEGRRARGYTDADLWEIGLDELRDRVRFEGALKALYTPHCARVQPARLARGIADACEARGVVIHERTPALEVAPGRVTTPHGTVRARIVVQATESYTTQLPGERRRFLPIFSHMIATEPLPDAVWDELGWDNCEPIADQHYHFLYAQRTVDDRIAIGGRGAPYAWNSAIRERDEDRPRIFARIEQALRTHFPAARAARITHRWGGAFAAPRDWSMAVRYDPSTGFAWAGGFSGHGLSGTNIAGRTLADLIRGEETDLTSMPWVGRTSPMWEPEPLRFIAARLVDGILWSADGAEDRTGQPARRVRIVRRFMPGR